MLLDVKLVIFDMAGTVLDYGSCAPLEAVIEGFKRYGITMPQEKVRRLMGSDKKDQIKAIVKDKDVAQQWETVHGNPITASDIERIYRELLPLMKEIVSGQNNSLLIPGALTAQNYLRSRGIKIAVTTGYPSDLASICLRQAVKQGFESDAAVCSCDVPEGRPAPWMALKAMRLLGIECPNMVVKIGDTEMDIAAGLNAGMWSVGVTRTGNMLGLRLEEEWALSEWEIQNRLEKAWMRMKAAGAHFIIESIADCPSIVEKISEGFLMGKTPVKRDINRFIPIREDFNALQKHF